MKPYNGIFEIEVTFGGRYNSEFGTAWMIKPKAAVTAAHVLFPRRRGRQLRPTGAICRRYQQGRLVGEFACTDFAIPTSYLKGHRGPANDFAVVKLAKTAGPGGHRFGYNCFQRCELEGFEIEVAGFPVAQSQGTLVANRSAIGKITNGSLHYAAMTYSGQSGGPVFARVKHGGKTYFVCVGIHKGSAGRLNRCCRITKRVVNKIREWSS